ncbi:MAG: tyrosine--tRNA ligase [Eubacteriales bacterium]|nr:tyrosine--tRNA ligase [Eubacteriales bacterium]
MAQENIYDVLKARGYVAQVTHEEELRELLGKEKVVFYTGYDPTADSLHVGHLVQMMVMSHLQRAGHFPIVLLGGGTGMIGDPSGRTDMRKFLDKATIQHNVDRFKKQMEIVLDFSEGKALMLNNAEWIAPLNYVEFLREFGPHFSVNRMLTAECYKNRLEQGLTFLEFNYMLLQAYDFYYLNKKYNCRLEMGGDDQWSNILAGTDLIRRKGGADSFGLTFQLLTKADGTKMGKTASGALWLDANKCSVYDFYQYFVNIDDRDVAKCMRMLTFMPLEEIDEYAKLEGQAINEAKKRLALEVTTIVHGREAAEQAAEQAKQIFGSAGRAEDMPGIDLEASDLGRELLDILVDADFLPSKSEGRRLIKQQGLALNDEPVTDFGRTIENADFHDGAAVVRRGKKNFFALKYQA